MGFQCMLKGQSLPDSVKNSIQDTADFVISGNIQPQTSTDSIPADTVKPAAPTYTYTVSVDSIDAPITYSAEDSIIYDLLNNKIHLYGNAHVTYTDMELTAYYIQLDWTTNVITAYTDSVDGEPVGDAVFKDAQDQYEAKKIMYNFQTKKGKVFMGRTETGQGYVHADAVKRNEYNEWYGYKGKYTTCSLEHPHFYIGAKKMKVVPDKVMVTGPANLVIHDVPTPLFVPFGIFPNNNKRHSGVIFPEYGEEKTRGFFLRSGGYYFSISDYMDLALTGDIYTNGSWAVRTQSNYAKRYKFRGNVFLQYGRNRLGEPESPDFTIRNDFRVTWTHSQDAKARPNSRFSANVNFGTSTFNKNNTYTQSSVTQSTLVSKISYSRTWSGRPFNFSMNMSHDQNLITGLVNLTLPDIRFGVSRIQPFKSKKPGSKQKWYESIGFSYTFETRNQISAYDSSFFQQETLDNMKYGVRQTIPINASIKLGKYFTFTPGANYVERWYMKTISKHWDGSTQYEVQADSTIDTIYGQVITDTIFGFKPARDFNFSAGLTTNMYGYLRFKHSKLKAIRHKMTPTLSFRYRPDFGSDFWGYYRTVQSDTAGNMETYSIFQPVQSIYGAPPGTPEMGLGININNNLEMKVFSKKDTVTHEKKIKLIENLSISTFYNFMVDSLNLSPISISGFTTVAGLVRINFSTSLDPYMHDSLLKRVNTFVWEDRHRFTSMRTASLSLSTSLRSKIGGDQQPTLGSEEERNMVITAPNAYYDFTIPWNLTFSYNLSISRGVTGNADTLLISSNSMRLGLDVTITPKWLVHVESGFDFRQMELVYTRVRVIRNMHCWEMSFDWVPYPFDRQTYNMQINVKSPVLQELKLSRKKNQFDSAF